jgi:serine/threonine protein kinase
MALPDVAHVLRQIAAALSAVHDKGVVHRDLKPENVFLIQTAGVRDFVKVFDFGISKVHAAQTQLTRSAVLLGTPEYMAPEQTTGRGEAIDHRTDQWALACVAWCMLTGKPPFTAEDVTAILFQAAHQPPPGLRKLLPDLPDEVESVLLRALAKSPRKRFPTIAAFARAFEQACGGALERTPAVAPVPRYRRLLAKLLSGEPRPTQRLPSRTSPAGAGRPRAVWLLVGATIGAASTVAAQALMR